MSKMVIITREFNVFITHRVITELNLYEVPDI